MEGQSVGQASLADIIFQLCVNFLMYALLILVMYMMVRFYLEEDFEFDESTRRYSSVSIGEEENDKSYDSDGVEIEMAEVDSVEAGTPGDIVTAMPSLIRGMFSGTSNSLGKSSPLKKAGSFLNLNEWGEPEGTKQEVIQRAVFCAVGLNACFVIWGLLQERMLTQPYNGEYFVFLTAWYS